MRIKYPGLRIRYAGLRFPSTRLCFQYARLRIECAVVRKEDITIGDLCELTGYSRDQLRGLLAELPRFARRDATARIARVYSNHDALLVVLLCRLETVYGIKRALVAQLNEPIAAAVSSPRQVSDQARLLIRLGDKQLCQYVEGAASVEEGLVVPLGPVFAILDSYLAPTPFVQRELGLPAVLSSPLDDRRQVRAAKKVKTGKTTSRAATTARSARHE